MKKYFWFLKSKLQRKQIKFSSSFLEIVPFCPLSLTFWRLRQTSKRGTEGTEVSTGFLCITDYKKNKFGENSFGSLRSKMRRKQKLCSLFGDCPLSLHFGRLCYNIRSSLYSLCFEIAALFTNCRLGPFSRLVWRGH